MTNGLKPPSDAKTGALSNAAAGLVAGLSFFLFLWVARRALGPVDFVPLGQLLIVWPISHAIVAFPVQQLRARSDEAAAKAAIGLTAAAVAALIPLFLLFGEEITRSDNRILHLIAIALPLGALSTAWGRGTAAAQGRDRLLATLVAGENVTRLLIGVVLWLMGAGPVAFSFALVAGFFLNALVLGSNTDGERPAPVSGSIVEQTVAMTAIGGMGYAALFLAPGSIALGSATNEVVAALLFAMAAYRAPYQIIQSMVPKFAAEFSRGRWLNTPVPTLAVAGLMLGASAGLGAALLGPWLLNGLVGDGDLLARSTHGMAAAATTVASLNVIGAVALTAKGQFRPTAAIWILPALCLAYPLSLADEPRPIVGTVLLYVASVFVCQIWLWYRTNASAAASEASL